MHRTELIHPHIGAIPEQITCVVLAGPPGSGKSTRLTGEAIHVPGVVIIAAPRIDLVEEHAARLRALIDELDPGSRPNIQVIHSEQTAGGSVDRRLRKALLDPVAPQLIIVTTYAGLMGLEEEDIAGCHVGIDEIPETAIVADEIGLGASWPDALSPRRSPPSARSKPVGRVYLPDHDAVAHRTDRVQYRLHSVEETDIAFRTLRAQILHSSVSLDNRSNRLQPVKTASSPCRNDRVDRASCYSDCVIAQKATSRS